MRRVCAGNPCRFSVWNFAWPLCSADELPWKSESNLRPSPSIEQSWKFGQKLVNRSRSIWMSRQENRRWWEFKRCFRRRWNERTSFL